MAQVPGIVYVLVGALVTVVSLLIGKELVVFFYVGIGFLVFGTVVSFIGAINYHNARNVPEKHAKNAQTEIARRYPQYAQQYANPRQQPRQAQAGRPPEMQRHPQQQVYRMCMRCRTPAFPQDRFCRRFGIQLS